MCVKWTKDKHIYLHLLIFSNSCLHAAWLPMFVGDGSVGLIGLEGGKEWKIPQASTDPSLPALSPTVYKAMWL